jgi:hypothetical protein
VKRQGEVATTTEGPMVQHEKPVVQLEESTTTKTTDILKKKDDIDWKSINPSNWEAVPYDISYDIYGSCRKVCRNGIILQEKRVYGRAKRILSLEELPRLPHPMEPGVTIENKYFVEAALSPNGKKVAFVVSRGSLGGDLSSTWLGIFTLENKQITILAEGGGTYLLWSPNGRYLATEGLGEFSGFPEINIYDVDKVQRIGSISNNLRINHKLAAAYGAKWSDDSKKLYFRVIPNDLFFVSGGFINKDFLANEPGDLWEYDLERGELRKVK